MRGAGAEWPVAAMKPGNAGGAKGLRCLAEARGQPPTEGALGWGWTARRSAAVEHREPCEVRASRTVLGTPGGEIPPGDCPSLHPGPGRAVLSLARRRSERGCTRHPRSGPARCQRRESLLQAASEGFAICTAGDRDRQAEELWRGLASTAFGRRALTKPISEQSDRQLASTDATTRAPDAAVQIDRAGPGLSLRSLVHLRSLPSSSTPTSRPCLSCDSVGRFQTRASGDLRPPRSVIGTG